MVIKLLAYLVTLGAALGAGGGPAAAQAAGACQIEMPSEEFSEVTIDSPIFADSNLVFSERAGFRVPKNLVVLSFRREVSTATREDAVRAVCGEIIAFRRLGIFEHYSVLVDSQSPDDLFAAIDLLRRQRGVATADYAIGHLFRPASVDGDRS